MLILLPKEKLSYIESSLTLEMLSEYKDQMQETKLDAIYLPKFEFETKYFMGNILSALGMPSAFSPEADFSGISGRRDLFISEVIHQAYIKLDEEGTEAAAATGIVMVTGMPSMKHTFIADHPFIFIIQDRDTGNILFIGRVADPR